jgi:hypothetical protein
MTDWMSNPAVRDNGDGTWMLADESGRVHAGCWQIVPHAGGWRAYCHGDNFGATVFATPADAVGAVLGDPGKSHVLGGRLWTVADCGFSR